IGVVPSVMQGGLPVLLKMIINGTADMALPPHDRISTLCRKFGCVSLPFVFDDHEHADRVLDDEFLSWATPELESFGLSFLGSWEWGFRQITNAVRPILTPQDMRGLKIRVPPVLHYQAAIEALGATPVAVEFGQLADVIKDGIVDGQENPVSIIHGLGLYEWQRYLSVVNYNYSTIVHLINKKSFENLSSEQQQILREESQRAGALMRQIVRAHEVNQLAALFGLGMQVDRPDLAPFKAAMGAANERLTSMYRADNVAAFLAMVERHRK
ncbi:MAG TPA: TRAP transporter substrate-binding protein, partial [Rhodocyclaceae bacterium]|nr:TRAP transporter substrate-binding protein [Rhodocyclaceae bacterium]